MGSELAIIGAAIAGLILAIPVLLHPIGPSLLVFAISPIDPILGATLGMWGNYITGVPIALVLLKTGPAQWIRVFFGSRIQVALFLFIAVSAISHLIGYAVGVEGILLNYLQRVTGFLLVGVVAAGLRHERYLDFCMKLLVVGSVGFALLSIAEFYFGIQLLPAQSEWGAEGLMGQEYSENVNLSRLRGVGDSLTINRFALQLLVPIGMTMAWLSPRVRRGLGVVPLGCLIVLLTALFGTMSRGGLVSLVVGAAIVMIAAYRLRPASVLAVLTLAVVLGTGVAYTLNHLGVGDELESRLTSSELDEGSKIRKASWLHGLNLFADSPVWGVGFGVWGTDSVRPGMTNPDPHNAYIRILAFHGILGGVFFVYLIYSLYSVLLQSAKDLGEKFEFWRPYYVAALTAFLTMNLFNSYFFDRYFFLIVGFAAALEHAWRDAALRGPAGSRFLRDERAEDATSGGSVPTNNGLQSSSS
jgi:hypothetical protein